MDGREEAYNPAVAPGLARWITGGPGLPGYIEAGGICGVGDAEGYRVA